MKWFMATNEHSLGNDVFYQQLQVAVLSAAQNTELDPYLLYDGGPHERLAWIKSHGVTVLPHELSIRNAIATYIAACDNSELIPVRTGAYLKTEIPVAMARHGFGDEYVLYTDCDVIFKDIRSLSGVRPKLLAAHGRREGGRTRFRIGGHMHYNSGVMVLNAVRLRDEAERFRQFVLSNGEGVARPKTPFMQKHLFMSDQVALNVFFRGRVTRLNETYNWSPSAGINPTARIIHFNGLKWTQWDDFLNGRLAPFRMEKFVKQVNINRPGYEHYVELAKSYLCTA